MRYEFSPEIELLLLNYSTEEVQMQYDSDPCTWPMPKIGRRPPYYTDPEYVLNFPVI
ncbi:hypothetical protein [Muricomes intestini]|jgi:hypothetical protein|uniref:Uncharacterized protein n=1 Tax=Muricomes intestini TaxID=1796634 RepID=A0A4R3K0U9_9FIRM|nr:hypothetical protein [Muricomes intestini]TCS73575.1 hypothetical protein EDD59_1452 [Muricomes intestini]